jgi:hypothetical protein
MRLEKQNRRSCIGLMVALALLAGLILWASLGGVPGESIGDDVKGGVGVPPGPAGTNAPVDDAKAAGAGKRRD